MSAALRPSLEDLRMLPQPAWLWDTDRRRIVWANASGLAAFHCNNLLELVDRPFDARDPGVERLAGLAQDLSWGQDGKALLHFPSSGSSVPFACSVFVHALADGRPGILAVVNEDRAVETVPPHAADGVVDLLPFPAALVSRKGKIIRGNTLFDPLCPGQAPHSLQALLGQDADTMLSRVTSKTEERSITIQTPAGLRHFAARLTPLESLGGEQLLLILLPASGSPSAEPPITQTAPAISSMSSKEDAFAALSKSLRESLAEAPQTPVTAKAVEETPVASPAEVPLAAPGHSPVVFPNIPTAIQQTLEQAPFGIVVCRNGEALFATARAATMLGHGHAPAILTDKQTLAELASVPAGLNTILDVQRPGVPPLMVTRLPLPWHNGPAEQFTLRPYVVQPVPPAVQAAPLTAKEPQPSTVESFDKSRDVASVAVVETSPPAKQPIPNQPPDDKPTSTAAIALDELKAILDVASDGIVTLAQDGSILSLSAAAEAIFGVHSQEALGKPMRDFLHADSRKTLRDYLAGLSGPGIASLLNDGREMTAVNAQGGHVPLFVTMGKLQSPSSRAAFCAVVRDLTPSKKTERDLIEARDRAEAASRQKSQFLARISHELRTPLNAILGFSDVMRTQRFGPVGNDKYLAYANDIHASGTHLLSVVNDLLDLSKVEAGRMELDFMAVNLEEVADYAMNLLQGEAASAGVLLRKSMTRGLPRVVGDLKSLRQVLINLLSNSIKYTDTGGEVLISASVSDDGTLALRIKDTGIGMTSDQLEDALRPFGRVETASRQRQGTGLGLPLARSLVEANRARFSIISTPGKGTLAEIAFPGPRVLAE